MAEQRTPLDKLDPVEAWKPWQPTAKDDWDLKWAGHLYRRAAFGASPVELAQAVKAGHQATLDLLLKGKPDSESFTETRDSSRNGISDIGRLRAWWLYWILKSQHPLREKMTLFWHNHFVSSFDKVSRIVPISNQNVLLYEHALGRFGPFVMAISHDVAMLEYLDSNSNLKSHPNENYGRELMELFTLGVGNYTEKDVREVARAFTGWNTNGDDQFEFVPSVHDTGAKTVLGTTGPLDGKDVVDILLKQPACARFLVGKLYRFLISENETPPDALLEPLAEQLRKSDYDIAALVATMLSSRHFFSDHAFRQRIKSPVELVIGAVRTTVDPEYVENTLSGQGLVPILEAMGQNLFAPPNVKGWRGGKNWLNTATMLARQNFGQSLAMGTLTYNPGVNYQGFPEPPEEDVPLQPQVRNPKTPMIPEEPAPRREIDAAVIVSNAKATKPEDVVRVLIDAYLPGGVSPTAKQKLAAFIGQGNPKGPPLDRRIREAVHAILGMPEYQLA
jgi:hypothetical protein